MIRIKLVDFHIHRNECTFRPFWVNRQLFRQHGIDFVTDTNQYDLAWIGHASISDKQKSLEQSVNDGLDFLKGINGPYVIVDGQDSASLMGTVEVFNASDAIFMLKSSLYKDRTVYFQENVLGRSYWNHIKSDNHYRVPETTNFEKIHLLGTNWLSTHFFGIDMQWLTIPKTYDVCALFQYPSLKPTQEHGHVQHECYDAFRKPIFDVLDEYQKLGVISIARLSQNERLPQNLYYQKLSQSRILIAPFGYGEMAPRDLESAIFGAILIKPNMDHIETMPNIFTEETYLKCAHDFSDLNRVLNQAINIIKKSHFPTIVNNMRTQIENTFHPLHIVNHIKTII